MIDAICTYGGERKVYSIYSFQNLPALDIERFRQFLECPNPKCSAQAYYRKKSVDGKAACFGSRYHIDGCSESRISSQRDAEVRDANEVSQLLKNTEELLFDFSMSKSRLENENRPTKDSTREGSRKGINKKHLLSRPEGKKSTLGMDKALNSLMRGSNLGASDILIEIDKGYKYKARNLFVNFAEAEPYENLKTAKPKMFWGTISHADNKLDWLNPSDCSDMGIPILKHKNLILKRFGIQDRRDLEGAGIILFGKCYWNSEKTRKIIDLWSTDRIYLSLVVD